MKCTWFGMRTTCWFMLRRQNRVGNCVNMWSSKLLENADETVNSESWCGVTRRRGILITFHHQIMTSNDFLQGASDLFIVSGADFQIFCQLQWYHMKHHTVYTTLVRSQNDLRSFIIQTYDSCFVHCVVTRVVLLPLQVTVSLKIGLKVNVFSTLFSTDNKYFPHFYLYSRN